MRWRANLDAPSFVQLGLIAWGHLECEGTQDWRPNERRKLATPSMGDQSAKADTDCRLRGVRELSRKAYRAFDFPAPATALPALTKKPCRWDCERRWQGSGIHRHAAGNVLYSFTSFLPTAHLLLFSGRKLKMPRKPRVEWYKTCVIPPVATSSGDLCMLTAHS
jgi:hypothetical protein